MQLLSVRIYPEPGAQAAHPQDSFGVASRHQRDQEAAHKTGGRTCGATAYAANSLSQVNWLMKTLWGGVFQIVILLYFKYLKQMYLFKTKLNVFISN